MGRHLGQRRPVRSEGRPFGRVTLVALVAGLGCAVALSVAGPARADDESGPGRPGLPVGHDIATAAQPAHGGSESASGRTARRDAESKPGDAKDDDSDDPPAQAPPTPPPVNPNVVPGTPCTKTARACVELATQHAWLIDATGKVTTGPVPVSSGGPGAETPIGTFAVRWKDKNHFSKESRTPQGAPAPMPYSVFFTPGGVAFHGGSVTRASAGCVHLNDADAITFFNTLKVGQQVQVH
jgi:lipoprotein-anchoring transpeptidase ErfK/SrfK